MQIIKTKYLSPTNHKGARIKASTDNSGKQSWVICSYEHRLTSDENHLRTARFLRNKLKWDGDWFGGHSKDGMIFVNKVIEYKL